MLFTTTIKLIDYVFLSFFLIVIFVNNANCQQTLVANIPSIPSTPNIASAASVANSERSLGQTIKYPIVGNNPFPLIMGVELEKVNQALLLAKELTKRCECDRALQDYGVESLAQLLKSEVNINLFDGRTSTLGLPWMIENKKRETVNTYFLKNQDWLWAGVIQAPFTGKGNVIFLNHYFFSPTKSVSLALEQRSIILIHESVHQFGNKDDNHFGGSKRLTNLITRACLPNLKIN